jgi:arginine decarboxylase
MREREPANAGEELMNTPAKPEAPRVDQFFMAEEARFDRWRTLLHASRLWNRSLAQQESSKAQHQATVTNSLQELRQWEDFFAYPGQKLVALVEERISSGDATGAARLIQSISNALLTHSYRSMPHIGHILRCWL